jgi:hypothetical protein
MLYSIKDITVNNTVIGACIKKKVEFLLSLMQRYDGELRQIKALFE